ncbi:YicC/YloC family endoribonuclease [Aporhodopirellula aestuarii]|uniref:YicC family protein n=1 Tax=Aporhodopirellula aestuarii TaxID=2950107 RepID=A0ABT0U7A4_9BACT|nr:YicC/YloC family endoribonuclease [Aporhodopirellula aestuarii]MCM2372564.1 YicC family protein [Aporhodopirellula aestuarii]
MTDVLFPHLRSMTGQGRSEICGDEGTLVVELRSVNHRGLKLVLRTNEALNAYEGVITEALRGRIERGTVTVHATLKPPPGQDLPRVNQAAVSAYARGLSEAVEGLSIATQIDLSGLLTLPGVLSAEANEDDTDEARERRRQFIAEGVVSAVERFNRMRHHEAVAMGRVLQSELSTIQERAALIQTLAPGVIERYRARLLEKIQKMLAEHHLPVEPVEIVREVQLFADRSDISEELTRLASHLELFRSVLEGTHPADSKSDSGSEIANEAVGRKLDFIIQEMFRETNTIGSKAGNAKIAEHIVEIKCAIERMRELVQNLE